jgi:hypothetical protein
MLHFLGNFSLTMLGAQCCQHRATACDLRIATHLLHIEPLLHAVISDDGDVT